MRKLLQSICCGLFLWHATLMYAQTTPAIQLQPLIQTRGIELTAASLVQYAGQGDWVTMQLLLNLGVSMNAVDDARQVTALHAAASQGHDKVVKELLALSVAVDAQDVCGNTALVNAAYARQAAVVGMLLRTHAVEVNHQPRCGLTPLIAAIYGGDINIVRQLLDAKANPNLVDKYGTSPLQAARLKKRMDFVPLLEAVGKP
jgi:uncharacterized protein